MTERFEAELEKLRQEIFEMGTLARAMFCDAVESLVSRDAVLADHVVARKEELRDLLNHTEDHAYEILTLYQPVARDLRTVVACLKVAGALERIGRYGKAIAKIEGHIEEAGSLEDRPQLARMLSIPQMSRMVGGMIDTALSSFKSGDLSVIRDFGTRDDGVDALNHSIFRECITYMLEDPRTITRCTRYVMVARYLERSADHACTIAEATVFMQTGERVEIK
ncbi:MAG: phosphate signaling complex protein PhoU [Methanospirillum sp.]